MGYLCVPRGVTGSGAVTFLPESASAGPTGRDWALWGSNLAAPHSRWCPWKALWLYRFFWAARQQLLHLPAEVVAGGWLRHREPCRRNRLFSSCPPWERRLTPPRTWMHRTASNCPPLCSPCRFAAHPSARYCLDKSKATQRRSILCGCCLRGNRPELPFGHRRSAWEVVRALHGQRHLGNPGIALMLSLNVGLDRSA